MSRLDDISPLNPEEAGARLTVNLGNLKHNYLLLARHAGSANCAAVIKANGYGLGLTECTNALLEAGADTFFVAQIAEARCVRNLAPSATIYVLAGIPVGAAGHLAEINATPVICCMEDARAWAELCRNDGINRAAALHVDTGLNRLGISLDEINAFRSEFCKNPVFDIALIMTHFACADEPDHPLNKIQMERFDIVRAAFPGIPASLANSASLLWEDDARSDITFDVARPGIALYGSAAGNDIPNPMKPVARLEGTVIQVRRVATGDTVGYGATFTARRPSRFAILSVGYADGYHRSLGNGGEAPHASVAIGQTRVPVVGRVSMDLIAIDVTDLPETAVARGTLVELFGDTISIDEVAFWSNTIAYEILTRLGPRLYRIFEEASE